MSRRMMNQMNGYDYKIDSRSNEDIENRIAELAKAYVPQWNFDRENPDIGSVIGKIFAGQMADNITKYNQVIDKYRTEFVNMLGISLLPAKPATATVVMDLVQDTIPGVEVYKGTQLLAENDESEEPVIFETLHNLYVTNAQINQAFMVNKDAGKIIPLLGSFKKIELVQKPDTDAQTVDIPQLRPFRLFDSYGEGLEKNALLFYHSTVLNVENDNIYIKLTGSSKLLRQIEEGIFRFEYYTENGFVPVETCKVMSDVETVVINKSQPCQPVEIDGGSYSVLALITDGPIDEAFTLTGIKVSSSGSFTAAQAVNNGSNDFDPAGFNPFGDTISVYNECYIGHNEYFGKAGAKVTLEFDVTYRENRIIPTVQEEEAELKIIKRKPKVIWTDSAAEAHVEEIAIEYFNGLGWKKLNCDTDTRRIFAEDTAGKYTISFTCPDDWQESGSGAYYGRAIRMQVLKSDNCYDRPCVHHYPCIRNLNIAYSYEEHYMDPQKLVSVAGTDKYDLTRLVKEEKPFRAFPGIEYHEDALYLGFERRIESGPVSLLFRLDEGVPFDDLKCRFEYSTQSGFKQMKVMDNTADMSRSGTVMFIPQSDMQDITVEGKKAYWIRISRSDNSGAVKREQLPVINDIRFNAVTVSNVETRLEEDFYLESVAAGAEVNLGVSNILDVELWVNEKGRHTRAQMKKMQEEMPDEIQVEKDISGEISAFYVRWYETEQFDDAETRRCYLLDRMNSRIIFGDGINTEIPRVMDDVAFKAKIRCCNGSLGNVEAGMINDTMTNLLFVEQIYNPVKAYGGSNMESIDNALTRGANILKSRRRFVSADDYIQEILCYSDSIDKVKCIMENTVDGKKTDGAISFVLLMKDYKAGSYSFHNIAGNLKKHLLNNCEITVSDKDISIVEPIFAKVSVDVWAQVSQMDDSFEVQNLLSKALTDYLNPVASEYGPGWDIGTMPKKSQLLMKLNMLKSKAVIKKMVASVKYTDKSGSYEVDLEDIVNNPFMICTSGSHRINIMLQKD